MKSSQNLIGKSFYLNFKPIRSKQALRIACKHNFREIQAELGAHSHIDAAKIHLNQSLVPKLTTSELMQHVTGVIDSYEERQSRRIRKDAVIAIEVLFSLPVAAEEIPIIEYFEDCLAWTLEQFKPGEILTADIHFDEAAPHMHVILLAITASALHGAKIKGNKYGNHLRQQHFCDNVAAKYGLQKPPARLSKSDRVKAAKKVLSAIESSADPLTQSSHFQLIKRAIEEDPAPWAQSLGIEIEVTPAEKRTFVQIMTSKGKGPQWQPDV